MRSWGGGAGDGISVPYEKGRDRMVSLSSSWGHSDSHNCAYQKRDSPGAKPNNAHDLEIAPSLTRGGQHLWLKLPLLFLMAVQADKDIVHVGALWWCDCSRD